MTPGYRLRSNHLEEESEGDRKIHRGGRWRGGETSLNGKYKSGEE